MFFVTNVAKCYPRESKKPNQDQIKTCGENYLEKELQAIKPIVILAFGNTCLQFFENQKSGIMGKSGSIKWNEKYGAWIVWCLHPAASLYNADNEVYFKSGMKKFVSLLRSFSLKNQSVV
jgi:DNA polymerase